MPVQQTIRIMWCQPILLYFSEKKIRKYNQMYKKAYLSETKMKQLSENNSLKAFAVKLFRKSFTKYEKLYLLYMSDNRELHQIAKAASSKLYRDFEKIKAKGIPQWDAAKKKPLVFSKRIQRLKTFYEHFSSWEKESLKGRKDLVSTIKRLRNFADLYKKLSMIKAE